MTEVTHTNDHDLIERDASGQPLRDDDHHPGDTDHHGPTDKKFITIFFILAALTAIEVAASYIDIGPAFLPTLLGIMAIKFYVVVMYFMHVKFDNPLFGQLFYIGLVLAVVVYTIALLTFRFFEG